jgi:hypothetical protein
MKHIIVLEPIVFGPLPEWMYPHEAEPEIRHYLNGPEPRVRVRPCYCPLSSDHPLHVPKSDR